MKWITILAVFLGIACGSHVLENASVEAGLQDGASDVPPGFKKILGVRLEGDGGFPIDVGDDGDGDLWFTTWADDGELYGTWSDGNGPLQTSGGCAYWTSLGVVSHVGPIGANTTVSELWRYLPVDPKCPRYDDSEKAHASSILGIDGVLYASFHTIFGGGVQNTDVGFLAQSNDHGQTWSYDIDGSPWSYEGPGHPYVGTHEGSSPFRNLMLFNMGQDYTLNTDGYVYAFGIGMEYGWEPQTVFLARVPTTRIMDYAAWTYWNGHGWSTDQFAAVPLPTLQAWEQGSAMWHEGTGSYLFLTQSNLYQAPHPWGPWTVVDTAGVWGVPGSGWWGYQPGLIAKDAGTNSFWFTFSGQPKLGSDVDYNLHYGRMILTLE